MSKLRLPPAPRSSVFREISRILRADGVLSAVVRSGSLKAWDGRPDDGDDLSTNIAPAIRITPTSHVDQWLFPGSQKGLMIINVEVVTAGYDVEDFLNLFWAVVRALYPSDSDRRNANVQRLLAAGAYDGLPTFLFPSDPKPADNEMRGLGQIRIDVRNDINN